MIDKAVEARMVEITSMGRSHVIPLYTSEGPGRGYLPVGSAVLVRRVDGYRMAVTAGHVMDNVAPLPLFTWGTAETGLVILDYEGTLTSEPARPNRKKDPVDLAAFPLDTETVRKLEITGAAFLTDIKICHDWDAKGIYVAIGFPHARNKVKRRVTSEPADAGNPMASRSQPRPYVMPNTAVLAPCEASNEERYREVNADLELNFVVNFRHKQVRDTEGKAYPHPRGMSGGAIFRIGRDDTLVRADEIQLAAIGTEYHEKLGLLIGASAPAVRHLVTALGGGSSSA